MKKTGYGISNYNRKKLVLIGIIFIIGISFLILRNQSITSQIIEVQNKNEPKSLRPNYCGTVNGKEKCIDPQTFKYLPDYPSDFVQIYELVYYGKINDLSKIDEKYWKQPEILPTWKTSGVNAYLNPEKGRFGAFGLGCYPAEVVAKVTPGQAVKLTTWLHTSWAIQTLQGMSLGVVYPTHADSTSGIAVEQDPSISRYFDASVSSKVVLLGPTWPYFESGPEFDHDGWILPITIDIKVHYDTPKGTYALGVMPYSPPQDKNDEWTLKYKLRYSPIQQFYLGKPYFTVFLNVE